MSADKHQAEALADGLKSVAEMHDINGLEQHAAMLCTIPALEAEAAEMHRMYQRARDSLRQVEAERDQLRAALDDAQARQPLTDEQIAHLDFDNCHSLSFAENQLAFARAVEAAHGIGSKP